jgi:hypothetical protein
MVALLAATGVAAQSSPPRIVNVTIMPNLDIKFSPRKFKRGTIVFKITNTTKAAHQFGINGVTSTSIRPNKTRLVKVVFKIPSLYIATLPDCGYLSMCVGGNPDHGPKGHVTVTR